MLGKALLRLLVTSATYYGVAQFAAGPQSTSRLVKAWLIGAALIFGSVLLGLLGLVILIAALFFELANYEQLVMPTLITGGISLLLAVIVIIEGLRLLRPGR